jgi:hypothetical protein
MGRIEIPQRSGLLPRFIPLADMSLVEVPQCGGEKRFFVMVITWRAQCPH